jgi:xanthine dehydrogenase accessory factor
LKSGQPATFDMLLDHDFGWDDGLICGGSVSGLILPRAAEAGGLWRKLAAATAPVRWGVKKDFSIALWRPRRMANGFIRKRFRRRWTLWIAGSGHVAQAVAPLALQLDFAVTVFDDRPELANHEFFPPDVQLRVGGWHEF